MILLIITAEVAAGFAIGCLVAVVVFRSRHTLAPATIGAVLGAVGFLVGGAILGWASSRVVMVNDLRLDVGPSGESLWLRNRLAERATVVYTASACLFPLVGFLVRSVLAKRVPRDASKATSSISR
jgi:xanthosine utilization system XapX-like protein